MALIGRESAEVYQPQVEGGESRLMPVSPDMRLEPWRFVHYPWNWQWHDEHGFLPELNQIHHKPGCNGVFGFPGQRPDPRLLNGGVWSKGGTILAIGDPRLGPWKNYLISFPVDLGNGREGKHYAWCGDVFEKLPRRAAQQTDQSTAWWKFLLYVRDHSGICAEMPGSTYNLILGRAQQALTRLQRRKADAEVIDLQRARIAAMQAAWSKMVAAGEPQPVAPGAVEEEDGSLEAPPPKPSPKAPRRSVGS